MNQQILQMLREFGRDRRTGILTCESAVATRFLVLKEGDLVGARSSLDGERLGELLVRRGIITKQHLADASHFARRGKRLGEILAELDIIEEEEIAYHVSQQALEIACRAVLQAKSGADFAATKDVVQVLPEPLPVWEVLMEVSRQTNTVRRLMSSLQKEQRSLQLSEDSQRLIRQLRLRAYEALVLKRIERGGSVASIFSESPVSVEETTRAIMGYLSIGAVEFADGTEDTDVAAPSVAASPR